MSEYRRKLRSSKSLSNNKEEDVAAAAATKEAQAEAKNQGESSKNKDRESPKTPPIQSIEPYFPPSPYGKKRHQPHGDRFIPSRDRNLIRDFQMAEHNLAKSSDSSNSNNNSSDTPIINRETRRINAYFRAEVLDDPLALQDYILPENSRNRIPRRILNYHDYDSSYQSSTITVPDILNISPSSSSANITAAFNNIPSPEQPVLSPSNNYTDPSSSRYQTSPISEAGRRILTNSDKYSRQINTTAIKILDAPELQDDFYLNLVDWGPNDCLAVGLGSCVYLWNSNTSRVTKLCDFVTDAVTSVNWSSVGTLLAVGTNSGRAILYDTQQSKRIRTWSTHSSRIGSIAWKSNILSTGGRDHMIYHHDVRSAKSHFRKLTGHTQEICGLKWNPEGTMLASGGNDNNLLVWDSHENKVTHKFSQHIAAVKAITWNPHKRGILVSGGGTADKTIKFWNTISGNMISSHDTGSQVCNIAYSKKTDDIVSTHGYANNAISSSNQVIVWKADKMQRIATLIGHTSRVLYMAMSNDGSTVVTGAGDETLRFWDIFSSVEVTRPEPEDRRSCLR